MKNRREVEKFIREWQKYLKKNGINYEALIVGNGLRSLLERVYKLGRKQ